MLNLCLFYESFTVVMILTLSKQFFRFFFKVQYIWDHLQLTEWKKSPCFKSYGYLKSGCYIIARYSRRSQTENKGLIYRDLHFVQHAWKVNRVD